MSNILGPNNTPIEFRLVKIMDIGYTGGIYFIVALIYVYILKKVFGKYDAVAQEKDKKKSVYRNGGESFFMMWFFAIVTYITTNLVELIPSPFNNLYGFQHLKLKQLTGGPAFALIFMFYQPNFRGKLNTFFTKLNFSN